MQRMRQHALDGAGGRDQRLAEHLPAEHALHMRRRARAAKQVHLELFEVENGEKVGGSDGGHGGTLLPAQ